MDHDDPTPRRSQFIGVRYPTAIAVALRERAEREGKTVTDVAIELAQRGLGISPEGAPKAA